MSLSLHLFCVITKFISKWLDALLYETFIFPASTYSESRPLSVWLQVSFLFIETHTMDTNLHGWNSSNKTHTKYTHLCLCL